MNAEAGAGVSQEEGGTPAGFEIENERYEIPRLDSFNMDEAQILYDVSGIVLEDFAPLHPDSPNEEKVIHESAILMRIRNPAFKRALIQIAYLRKNPDADDVEFVVGNVNALDASIALLRGDDDPPALSSPSEPDKKSSGNGTSKSTTSGNGSESDSDAPAGTLVPIGTGRSDTSSQESPAPTSAA